jgi:hypothetical protein
MTYEPVDIVALLCSHTYSEWVTDVADWRDALVAELERLAIEAAERSAQARSGGGVIEYGQALAYAIAAKLVMGEPI